jgi:Xaa-Pro dipeptidase
VPFHLPHHPVSIQLSIQTVEPGIYFSPHLLASIRNSPFIDHGVLAKYEKGEGVLGSGVGGVRIEDVVVVRKDGIENLTKVGSSTAWVESVCSGGL